MGGGSLILFRYKKLPPIEDYAEAVAGASLSNLKRVDMPLPKSVLEPGGSLVCNTTILLVKVAVVRNKENAHKGVIVNGGANVNLRVAQGWYKYQFVRCNWMRAQNLTGYNIGGPLCYAGDVLARDRILPELRSGDILGCLDTGAYTISAENRCNSYPLAAIVMFREDGQAEVIQLRESLADLAGGQI